MTRQTRVRQLEVDQAKLVATINELIAIFKCLIDRVAALDADLLQRENAELAEAGRLPPAWLQE